MSLLNLPSDGMHSVLVVLFKLLLAEKSIERERLLALCAPSSVVETNQVPQTLNTWLKLGLFEESSGKPITLHPDVRKEERNLLHLPRLARRLALRAENNANLWATEESKSADFTRAVCWLLAQDVYGVELVGWPMAEALLLKQVSKEIFLDGKPNDLKFITNSSRWSPLKTWVTWLGFGWSGRIPSGVLIIDPTESIRDALPEIFGRHKTMVADDLVFSLAEVLPVLDGGAYRREVESKLRERTGRDAWVPPPEGQLSTSLSRALLRLTLDGTIKAETRADAPQRVRLTGRNQSMIATFSHFTLTRKPLT